MLKKFLSKEGQEFVNSECQKMIAYNQAVADYLNNPCSRATNEDYCLFANEIIDDLRKMFFEAEGREDVTMCDIYHHLAYEILGQLVAIMEDEDHECEDYILDELYDARTQAELEGRKLSMYRDINALAEWWLEQHGFFEYKG